MKMLKYGFVGMLLASPAFAQQAPSNVDYQAALNEAITQRDLMSQRAISAAVQISQLQKQIEDFKKSPPIAKGNK